MQKQTQEKCLRSTSQQLQPVKHFQVETDYQTSPASHLLQLDLAADQWRLQEVRDLVEVLKVQYQLFLFVV